jgi:hypothetical protein
MPVGYLTFSARFMTNMNIIRAEKDKTMKVMSFVGNKTQIVRVYFCLNT